MDNLQRVASKGEVRLRVAWELSESPSFAHHGRFVNDPDDRTHSEKVLKNPEAWTQDRKTYIGGGRQYGYFAIDGYRFANEVYNLCRTHEDTPARDAAVAQVEAEWARRITAIANGDIPYVDMEVRASIVAGRHEVDIGRSIRLYEVEFTDDTEDLGAAVAIYAEENGLLIEAMEDARNTLAALKADIHNIIGSL
jgi:hypothetical protein